MGYTAKLYRRIRYGDPIIVVSGLPRSGTSMAMQMLEAGGVAAVTDGVRQPTEDNPKGYYEDERVKNLYREGEDRSWLRELRGRSIKVTSFLLKDLPDENNYKVLFMRRDLLEVLASQRKMLESRGEPEGTSDEKMLEIWKDHLWKANYLLEQDSRFDFIYMDYRDVVAKPLEQAERMRDFLQRPLDVEKMAGAVDDSLYRNQG